MPAGKGSTSTALEEHVFIEDPNQDGDLLIETFLNPDVGIGGVIDDVEACDRASRFMQGAANLLGLGVLVDDGGKDRYFGGAEDNDGAPLNGFPSKQTGSQGFGNNGAVGVLVDRGGSDRYEGMAYRSDNGVHRDCTGAAGFGFFADVPPPDATASTTTTCPGGG